MAPAHAIARSRAALVCAAAVLSACCAACDERRRTEPVTGVARTPATPATPVPRPTPDPDPGRAPCPSDMVLVDGALCPDVVQDCREHHPEYLADPQKSERCIRYDEPSRCRTEERILMRFCIDTYEWPNEKEALPRVLTSFTEASELCASAGKRLCNENEWLLACEGEQALPYVYGYVRDPTACVIDRLYVERSEPLRPWDACRADDACWHEFQRLDQREPSGSFERCVSPFGVFDMNGNVNEWVAVPGAAYPHRSGLKGGWWGPVRNRCRPTVRFHDESDWGYEVGFRCCRNAEP